MVTLTPEAQFLPGSLEAALHYLIEERIPEDWFEDLYANDELGRPAYSPKLLLKILLLGYARGLIGSRRLERACKENLAFMAIACGLRPDHSTLADFVEKLHGRVERSSFPDNLHTRGGENLGERTSLFIVERHAADRMAIRSSPRVATAR